MKNFRTDRQGAVSGRGASHNPANRFEEIAYSAEADALEAAASAPPTRYYKDHAKTIISYNDSPDVGFEASINPYRGCEHGCIYCYARPTHEYLGLSSGLDFESKIFVKENAPALLRKALAAARWQPTPIALSGVTDAYQPIERRLKLTRRCLEVLAEFRNPVGIVTKSHLITRDIDILESLNRHQAIHAIISITTLDNTLARRLEPRASQPERRLAAIQRLAAAGIPTGVFVAPMIPGLNDHEIPAILSTAAQNGAQYAGYVMLRLPYALDQLFEDWLTRHFPDRKSKILNRLRSMRHGQLNSGSFHDRMRGSGIFAEQIRKLFIVLCRQHYLSRRLPVLSSAAFRKSASEQLSLFQPGYKK